MSRLKIKEIIVVEGRDDTAAINRAVDAETIETHGFGMNESMWIQLDTAYKTRGLIVLTDPDRAGENIRKKIMERFPDAGQAYMNRDAATRKNDIGIENASPESIREALSTVYYTEYREEPIFSIQDLREAGLVGCSGSRKRRAAVSDILGIGYGNAAAMVSKLNGFGISREEFYGALQSVNNQVD